MTVFIINQLRQVKVVCARAMYVLWAEQKNFFTTGSVSLPRKFAFSWAIPMPVEKGIGVGEGGSMRACM